MTDATRRASDIVRETIERDGVVRHGLARGLINARALARSIATGTRDGPSFDAILGAIRRYPVRASAARREHAGRTILKLSLKNRVAVLSVRNHPDLQLTLARFAADAGHPRGETFRLVSSPDAVSVTIDSKNLDKLESKIPKADVLRKLLSLAEIVVEMSADVDRVPGALSEITTELTVNDVNIVQLATMGPGRVFILVEERDATRAYRALEALSLAEERTQRGQPGGPNTV